MARVGIFYHESFSRRSYLTVGRRLGDFPAALDDLLKDDRFRLYRCPEASDELILLVHGPGLIPEVEADPLCSTARASVGGVVAAAEKIATGEVDRAFAFIGAGGHHAGRTFFGGYCCFNDVAIAIAHLRRACATRRFAILDTDAHHGDGTRDIVQADSEVLHVCICGMRYESSDGTKVDVPAPWGGRDPDGAYLQVAASAFAARVREFRPDLTIWYFGFDGHQGDYGDMGLSLRCFVGLADFMVAAARDASGGRLLTVLGGGSRTDLATLIIPHVIRRLGEP
jgi:acetoin utilization deacetylase AcuC-like enzyme